MNYSSGSISGAGSLEVPALALLLREAVIMFSVSPVWGQQFVL